MDDTYNLFDVNFYNSSNNLLLLREKSTESNLFFKNNSNLIQEIPVPNDFNNNNTFENFNLEASTTNGIIFKC